MRSRWPEIVGALLGVLIVATPLVLHFWMP